MYLIKNELYVSTIEIASSLGTHNTVSVIASLCLTGIKINVPVS